MPEKEKNATDLIKELKADGGLKTENLELDDDQDDPTVEAGSSEERELLGKMEALLTDEAVVDEERMALMNSGYWGVMFAGRMWWVGGGVCI